MDKLHTVLKELYDTLPQIHSAKCHAAREAKQLVDTALRIIEQQQYDEVLRK